tara:strand:- start:118 stop:543 length:426 start_codon:yes stop_codon:yes gene_type:complete
MALTKVTSSVIADESIDEARLYISNAGSNGQYLQKQSGNNGGMTWADAGGAYNPWAVKTTTYTAVSGDQLICNHASTAFTVTLPASPSDGNTVIICNAGAATVTVGRNGSNINSAAEDATIYEGGSAQLVYMGGTIGWFEI